MTYRKTNHWFSSHRLAFVGGLLGLGLTACGGGGTASDVVAPDKAAAAMRDNRLLVERGRVAMRSGDSIRAEHYFALAVERGYDESELLPELLAVCLTSSRLRSALNYAEPYLRQHPGDSSLRYLVATLHLGLGQGAAARIELRTLLRHDPAFADAHFLLGMLEFDQEPQSAQGHLSAYLELRPLGDKSSEAKERLEQARFDSKTDAAVKLSRTQGNSTVQTTEAPSADSSEQWP